MKALLLAAGYGTRLKPLTEFIPKPLTLFMGRPILDIVYDQVRAAGIHQVAVNTHHLSDIVRLHTQKLSVTSQPIHISHEPEILGTGGSINPLRSWIEDDDILIFNGDIVSSVDLKVFIARYKASKAKAAMVLIPHKEGTTPVWMEKDRVVAIGGESAIGTRKTFAGVHIISRAFIEAMPREGFFSVIDTYQELLKAREAILAFEHQGFWADLGIPQDYLEAHREFWAAKDRTALAKELQLDASLWDYDAAQESLFVGTRRFAGAKRSFVFGAVGGAGGIQLDQCIVYPGVELTKPGHETGKIITPYASLNIL